jgi:hypothetical protein
MTNEQLLHLEKKTDINAEMFVKKLNICYMLSEIQHLYVKEIESIMNKAGYLGFDDKFIIKKAVDSTKRVMNLVRTVTDKSYSGQFEDNADELKFLIDKWAGL